MKMRDENFVEMIKRAKGKVCLSEEEKKDIKNQLEIFIEKERTSAMLLLTKTL